MLRVFLTTYPWDLVDEDVGGFLDRLRGEVGVTGVSVWATTSQLVQLRARDVRPRIFRTRGGLFFHPDETRYAGTRCKPIVSTWVKGKCPLKRISQACTDRGMELRVILSAANTGRSAQRHVEMACKNAFGDASHMGLCLANPDVQAYLCGLVSDLSSNYEPAGVTIADFVIACGEVFEPGLRTARPLGETELSLLSTCFCESCHQRAAAAGVDVAMARRSVQASLNKSFDSGEAVEGAVDAILADNTPLGDYCRWRTDELNSLLRRLVDACQGELLLDTRPNGCQRRQHADLDLNVPTAVITQIEQPDQLSLALCPGARRSELRLPEVFATGGHGPQLVSTLSKAAELGFAAAEIGNCSLLPDSALAPLKQAIRFARRSTNE